MHVGEAKILADVREALSGPRVVLMRNNSGAFKDEHGNFITYGVGSCWHVVNGKRKWGGGSDTIGFVDTLITPEMVGSLVPVFTAIEIKDRGQLTEQQAKFLTMCRSHRCLAGIARSVADAITIIEAGPTGEGSK